MEREVSSKEFAAFSVWRGGPDVEPLPEVNYAARCLKPLLCGWCAALLCMHHLQPCPLDLSAADCRSGRPVAA